MMDQEEKLRHYKGEIDKAKVELNQLEGEEKSLLAGLKDDYGISSVKEAEKKLKQLHDEEGQLQKELDRKLSEIEKNYEF